MKPLIVANWKMNPASQEEAQKMAREIEASAIGCDVILCPPFVFLEKICAILKEVKLGAQNCFFQDEGPFTGEVSPKMLKSFGVEYVILGHSERRIFFGEDDETINQKVKAVLKNDLLPILCIGETAEERAEGKTEEVIKKQLIRALDGTEKWFNETKKRVIVAYEPVWAIGSGLACDPAEAEKARILIKKIANPEMIIYGGSVNSFNAKDYFEKALFSGLLVGGASLDGEKFQAIITSCSSI